MSATAQQMIKIRDLSECTVFRGAAYSGETYYHGCYVVMDANGYWHNAAQGVQTTYPGIKGSGILLSEFFSDQALNPATAVGQMTATASGSLSANTNCFDIYRAGEFYATFESTTGINQASEGTSVYIYDNNTLTINPGLGLALIGRLTKYMTATTGYVKLDGLLENVRDDLTLHIPLSGVVGLVPPSSYNMLVLQNPYGYPVAITEFKIGISVPSTSGGTFSAGIAPTSSGVITVNLISSSQGDSTTAGIYSPANQWIASTEVGTGGTTVGHLDVSWGSTAWLAIAYGPLSSPVSCSSMTAIVASQIGWMNAKVRRI